MNFGDLTFDAMLRQVAEMPDPLSDEYTELSARVGWHVNENFEIAVKGFNLLNETHREYADPSGREIRRSVLAEIRFTY